MFHHYQGSTPRDLASKFFYLR